MKDLSTVSHHPVSEQIVNVLCDKTQNYNSLFFRVQVAYYFAKMASMQRTTIETHDRGEVPINVYALNLAVSGSGKGHSTNIIEEEIIGLFRANFLENTFPEVAEKNLAALTAKRAARKNVEESVEEVRVHKEFETLGELAFSFDSGTTAAVKQMRQKLLMANAGSMNMEIDEIGSNLLGQVEVLTTLLELYDVGKVKQKLTKNTNENKRSEEIDGRTPTNLLMFGTPNKLFDGGKIEDELNSFLETGYGRRCLFGYSAGSALKKKLTAQEIYDMATSTNSKTSLAQISQQFCGLADPLNFGQALTMSKDVSLLIIEYKLQCEERAEEMGEFDEIRRAEMAHRYFKMMKLAGAYAFVDGSHEITEDHLYAAMKLVEESGEAFDRMMARDRPYVKLAKYFGSVNREVTHPDLVEDLPFYKGSEAQKRELLNYATSWGYSNNIIIKRRFDDGIEFMKGETLQETSLDQMILSYSGDLAEDYEPEKVNFNELHNLTQAQGMHWANHHFVGEHRAEDNAIPGFNLVVLDIDDGIPMKDAELLLKDYKYLIHTSKSHQKDKNGIVCDRYRIILPLSHTLYMDRGEYKEFMSNIFEWLPFDVDAQTNQRSRKWLSASGSHNYNDGKMLDALLFIPKTSKCLKNKQAILDNQSLNNLERWFITHTATGNRSNNLIRYALMLADSGENALDIQAKVIELNSKLPDKMDEAEILQTIMVTVQKHLNKAD